MSVLDDIRKKYAKSESVADELGRILRVQRLDPSQKLAILEMTDSQREDVILQLILTASVRFVDDIAVPFPKTRAELNMTMRMLDEEGLQAVVKAYEKLAGVSQEEALRLGEPSAKTETSAPA